VQPFSTTRRTCLLVATDLQNDFLTAIFSHNETTNSITRTGGDGGFACAFVRALPKNEQQ
jgi:hypothetical protein